MKKERETVIIPVPFPKPLLYRIQDAAVRLGFKWGDKTNVSATIRYLTERALCDIEKETDEQAGVS